MSTRNTIILYTMYSVLDSRQFLTSPLCYAANIVKLGCPSSVRPSTFSNIFFFDATVAIEAKLHTGPQLVEGTKLCSRSLGHITKTIARPIYGKNPLFLFFSSPEPTGQWPWDLVCSNGDGPIIICSHDEPGLTLTSFYGKAKFGPFGKNHMKSHFKEIF